MKRIINGKKYDTDTATFIESYTTCLSKGDFRYYSEELYRKRNGEFFLCGEGGALSRYGFQNDDRSCCYGSKIIPITEDEAKDWVETHCSVSYYESVFGEVEE